MEIKYKHIYKYSSVSNTQIPALDPCIFFNRRGTQSFSQRATEK